MFRTFTKHKTSGFTFGKIIKILIKITFGVMILMYILAFFPQLFRYKDFILETNFKITLLLIALFIISWINFTFFTSKKDNSTGELHLTENSILLNGREFPLENLQQIRFIGNDIRKDFRGFVTTGQNNEIVLKTDNGDEIRSFFEQTGENNLKNLKSVLEVYRAHNLLSKANFDNILNNTNYY